MVHPTFKFIWIFIGIVCRTNLRPIWPARSVDPWLSTAGVGSDAYEHMHPLLPVLDCARTVHGIVVWHDVSRFHVAVCSACHCALNLLNCPRSYPPLAAISTHFQRRRAAAIGIAFIAEGLGQSLTGFEYLAPEADCIVIRQWFLPYILPFPLCTV